MHQPNPCVGAARRGRALAGPAILPHHATWPSPAPLTPAAPAAQRKITKGDYESFEECCEDFRLIFRNFWRYHGSSTSAGLGQYPATSFIATAEKCAQKFEELAAQARARIRKKAERQKKRSKPKSQAPAAPPPFSAPAPTASTPAQLLSPLALTPGTPATPVEEKMALPTWLSAIYNITGMMMQPRERTRLVRYLSRTPATPSQQKKLLGAVRSNESVVKRARELGYTRDALLAAYDKLAAKEEPYVRMKCPQMNFTQISRKIARQSYVFFEQVAADLRLLFANVIAAFLGQAGVQENAYNFQMNLERALVTWCGATGMAIPFRIVCAFSNRLSRFVADWCVPPRCTVPCALRMRLPPPGGKL